MNAVKTEGVTIGMITAPCRRTEKEERQIEREGKAFRRAAELCGLSIREIIRRGSAIYALQLLAKYDALPLTHPEPWRQFRVEDGGQSVSFRVRLPLSTFSQAVYIAQQVRKENGGGAGEDACEIAEGHLISRLSNLPAKNEKERKARNKAFMQWIATQKDLAARLEEIEREVENE